MKNTQKQRLKRKIRTRAKVKGTKSRPRLSVFRSNTHIYAQLIDDQAGKTLLGISDKQFWKKGMKKTDIANLTGELLAQQARKKQITKVVFDKGGYRYHGRVKALAEGARKGGLSF
jgi:large subunit ribosomal protein L18